ncbi:MAG TPA: tetratricopeptide repeat protein [Bryobacteraceae bacterium]|nr:tetratricopeptide repeat protein [Bryobacteraceae bacterium]
MFRRILIVLTSIPLALAQAPPNLSVLLANPREDSAEWHRNVGHAYYRAGEMQSTLDHLQKAIRLEPGNEQYYLDLGEVLARNNARKAVVVVFEAARIALPESFRIQSALGVAYLTIRNYEKAKQSFTDLIRTNPGYEMGYQLLAECYDITLDWENTAKIAAQLRALNPKNSNGWYYGATAAYGIGRQNGGSLQLAETQVRRALALSPGDWRPHLLLGKLLADSRRDREAVLALQKVIALRGADPKTYYILGLALKRLGRAKESAEAFQTYEKTRATHAASQRTLLVDIK